MRERTVFVTGGSGSIGRRLLLELRRRGWRTRALVHRRDVPEADEHVRGTILDESVVHDSVVAADAVVHLAGVTHSRNPRAYEEMNTHGTANVAAAAAAVGVQRFVHISTRAISPHGGAYSVSKWRAEETVTALSIEYVVLRLAEVYGSGGNEGVDRILRAARSGSPILVPEAGADELCPIYVDDAVDAIAGALDEPAAAGKTYTIGGKCVTVAQFADECRRAFGSRARIVRVPGLAAQLAAFTSKWLPLPVYPDQVDRLRSPKVRPSPEAETQLGFRVRPLLEGLRAAE